LTSASPAQDGGAMGVEWKCGTNMCLGRLASAHHPREAIKRSQVKSEGVDCRKEKKEQKKGRRDQQALGGQASYGRDAK